uniref:MADF domain-containing protein n=1 Tax=Trichogramma kaykai TaxID=54128 RepID=A0ABD2X112_9HYME
MPKTTNQKNLTEDQILSMLEHVQQHQELYKKSLTSYKDSKHKARVWEKIAILIGGGADAESLKKEWNSLKGKFTRYINHIKKIPSGSGLDKNIRPPPYYENLLFLKDNSLDNQILSSLDSDFEEQFCNRSRALPQKKSHDQESTTSASLTSPKDQSLEMATLTKEEEEDMTFFRSILHHVVKVKPEDKLHLRNEITDLVYKYAYQKNQKTDEDSEEEEHSCPCQKKNVENPAAPPSDHTEKKSRKNILPPEIQKRPNTMGMTLM